MAAEGSDRASAASVSVVVVSRDSADFLPRSLTPVVERGYQVIVVDNASSDGSAELVRRDLPQAELVSLADNVGFGAASNVGIGRARGAYVLLLNPDAWPVGDAVERLVACLEADPSLGMAGPRLESESGLPQTSFLGFPSPFWLGAPAVTSSPRDARSRRGARHAGAGARRDGFLVGAVQLARREALAAIGGFDESFFLFGEDVDLCRRLVDAGWALGLCPEATFVHVGGGSTRRDWTGSYREQLRGHLRFLAKHRGARAARLSRFVLLGALAARAAVARGEERRAFREARRWLAAHDVQALLRGEE